MPAAPANRADLRLQHVRRVGADHDQLAVRHVDHAHLAERERQAEGDEQQDRRDDQPLKSCSRNVLILRFSSRATARDGSVGAGRRCHDGVPAPGVSVRRAGDSAALSVGQALGPVVAVEARVGLDRVRPRPTPRRSGPSALIMPMRAVLETCWFLSSTVTVPSGVSSSRPLAASLTVGHVERAGLLGRRRPDVDGVVAGLDRVGRHPVLAVLGLEGRDELLVPRACRWSGSSSTPPGGPRCCRGRCRRPPPRRPTPRRSGSGRACCPWP